MARRLPVRRRGRRSPRTQAPRSDSSPRPLHRRRRGWTYQRWRPWTALWGILQSVAMRLGTGYSEVRSRPSETLGGILNWQGLRGTQWRSKPFGLPARPRNPRRLLWCPRRRPSVPARVLRRWQPLSKPLTATAARTYSSSGRSPPSSGLSWRWPSTSSDRSGVRWTSTTFASSGLGSSTVSRRRPDKKTRDRRQMNLKRRGPLAVVEEETGTVPLS
mmetsp:Transcript_19651/g.57352  ORF Transcript_19651/g.57352 Transcript_19651/m.57352 type:complete len:217 (-) Transcript_19651:2189-2839(-)